MVIDSNALKSDELREFLSGSHKNKAVVTDYLMIEALKGDPLGKIFGLMKILCEFPKQVIVLKPLRSISALKGRRSGMTRRMIEKERTKGMEGWCAGLSKAEKGDAVYRDELVENGMAADAKVAQVIAAQSNYAEVIAEEATAYTQDELQILRTDRPYTEQMTAKMAERIGVLTMKFLEAQPGQPEFPNVSQLPYTYVFRLAVCAYLQTLARIRDGGLQNVRAEKIANDILDATFAAQATYFQGLLSKDEKANALYRNAKHILKGFPAAPDKLKR
jgi:hypothetical protein